MLPALKDLVNALAFPATGMRAVLLEGAHGGFGDENGSSRGLSSPVDLKWLRATRTVTDAVVVSYGTAVREKYGPISLPDEFTQARASLGFTTPPKLVVVTRNSESALHAKKFAEIVLDVSEISLSHAVASLNEQGLVRLSCEGGPQLISAFMREGIINQLALSRSPILATDSNSYQEISTFSEKPTVAEYDEANFHFALHGTLATWKSMLPPQSYEVLRQQSTDRPFSVDYEKAPAPGYYICRGCGNRLFEADTQFDARCGWPAFWRPSRTDGVVLIEDTSHFMKRVEVRCSACDGHLGHVFEGEGFGFPTDQRYCINATALVRVTSPQ